MKVKSESEVSQLCQTLSDPMDCSPPGSSAHGIFQARVLEWGAISFSCFGATDFQNGNIKNVIIYILLNGGTIIELGISVLINKIQQRPKKH